MDDVVDLVVLDQLLVLAFLGHIQEVEFAGSPLLRLLEVAGDDVFWAASILLD